MNFIILTNINKKLSGKSYYNTTWNFPVSYHSTNYVVAGNMGSGHAFGMDCTDYTTSYCVLLVKNLNDSNTYTLQYIAAMCLGF